MDKEQFKLRIDKDLRALIEQIAAESGKSLNATTVMLLYRGIYGKPRYRVKCVRVVE